MPDFSRRDLLSAATALGLGAALKGCTMTDAASHSTRSSSPSPRIDLILHNAKITTMDPRRPEAQAIAIANGRFVAVGADADILPLVDRSYPDLRIIDTGGARIIPGLNDSHLHIIRGGLNYNLELRWDGVPSLADGMRMLRQQVARTPPGQWVRIVGGFAAVQFAERRLPTLQELNEAAPETPVFILHLYDRALLNRAALRAVGYDRHTPEPPGGIIERDKDGTPTGLLIANPNATILYKTLALGPKLPVEHQMNSTRHFMRELNRLGVTSVCDAGGGFQNFPEDYAVIQSLQASGELTVRIAYNLFTQKPQHEKEDFARWASSNSLYAGDDFLRLNGAGEMLVYSAADFEDFVVERPEMPPAMEPELEGVVHLLARHKWPFRLHATYDETVTRALNVFEKVHREVPIDSLRWFFDHCETISDRNIDRIKALGGGIAVQHRMAFQGEAFIARYGREQAARTPPVRRMLEMGVPVGAGTDATRVASYNPWTSLSWLTTGRTVGGTGLYPAANLLSRHEALRLYTVGSAWFSREETEKGTIAPGMHADLALLSDDYFAVPDDEIRAIESLLTIVGGKIVHAASTRPNATPSPFAHLAPPPIPVLPEWSPVALFGGHYRADPRSIPSHTHACGASCGHSGIHGQGGSASPLFGACSCWAF